MLTALDIVFDKSRLAKYNEVPFGHLHYTDLTNFYNLSKRLQRGYDEQCNHSVFCLDKKACTSL